MRLHFNQIFKFIVTALPILLAACTNLVIPEFDRSRATYIINRMLLQSESVETIILDSTISKVDLCWRWSPDSLHYNFPDIDLKYENFAFEEPYNIAKRGDNLLEILQRNQKNQFYLINIRPQVKYFYEYDLYLYLTNLRVFFFETKDYTSLTFIYYRGAWWLWGY